VARREEVAAERVMEDTAVVARVKGREKVEKGKASEANADKAQCDKL